MNPGEVIVWVSTAKGGKPRVSTMHLDCDTDRVHAALRAVPGHGGITKESAEWPAKQREQYIAELKKRGLSVYVVDNRRKKSESPPGQ